MVKEGVFYPRRCYKLFRIVKNLRWTGASPLEVLEFFNGDLLLPLFFNENLPPFFSSPIKISVRSFLHSAFPRKLQDR